MTIIKKIILLYYLIYILIPKKPIKLHIIYFKIYIFLKNKLII